MNKVQNFLICARSAGRHVAEPSYRRGAALDAIWFNVDQETAGFGVGARAALVSLLGLMEGLPQINDAAAICRVGDAILALADIIQAEMPKPAALRPRLYWTEEGRA